MKVLEIFSSPVRHSPGPICQVSPTQFAVGSRHDVLVCDTDFGNVVGSMRHHTAELTALASIKSSNLIASGTDSGELFVWEAGEGGSDKTELSGHTSFINHLINPETQSNLLLSSSQDKSVRVWDWRQEECLKTFDHWEGPVHCLDHIEERNVMMAGGDDKTVSMWDLRNYEMVGQIGPLAMPYDKMMQLTYLPLTHRLAVVSLKRAIRIYDVRELQRPTVHVITENRGDGLCLGWGCAVSDQNMFCVSQCDLGVSACLSAWKDNGEKLWETVQPNSLVNGVCPFGANLDFGRGICASIGAINGSVDAIIKAVDDQTVVAVTIKGLDGSVLRVPRTFCGPDVLDDTLFVDVSLQSLEEKDLCLLLTGTELPTELPPPKVLVLAKVFLALHLPSHLYHLCRLIEKKSDPSWLATLAPNCGDLVQKLQARDAADGDTEGDTEPEEINDDLEAVSESVLRCLVQLDWSSRAVLAAFVHSDSSVFVMSQFFTPPRRPFEQHAQFQGMVPSENESKSFRELFDVLCAELHESRRFSNVTLTTGDGGKEDVHLEILLTRSAFFHHVISFGGAELESLRTTKTIGLENFASDELSAYVSWIYLRKYPQDPSIRVFVRLLTHFHMHQEAVAEVEVLRGCLNRIRSLDRGVLILRLLENGHLIMNSVPDDLRDRLVSAAGRRLDLADGEVLSYLGFANDLGGRVDALDTALGEKRTKMRDLQKCIEERDASLVERDSRIKELEESLEKRECVCQKRGRPSAGTEGSDAADRDDDGDDEGDDNGRKKKRRKMNSDG